MSRATSYNAGNASSARVAHDYDELAARQPAFIGSQEVSDRGTILRSLDGYECVQLHTQPNSAHVALNIRGDLEYSNVQLRPLNKLTWVGRLVAGARKSGKSKAKYVLSADVDGVPSGVTHLVPSWTKKRCFLARRLARKQVAGCVDWFKAQDGPAVLVMDGNGPADHKVFAPLREVATPYARGVSHGIERDIIWVAKGAAEHVDVRALSGFSSDHPPVEADITWVQAHTPKRPQNPEPPKEPVVTKPLWLPDVIRKPIPAGSNDPKIVPVGDIFHVAVSMADSLHDFFENDGGIESTGYIRLDGTLEQYRPLDVECDAQGDGNSWVKDGRRYGFNSWETEGMGDGTWTDAQLATIKRIIAFKHEHFGHPLRRCPGPFEAGFGYHCLFPQWNHNNHSCPGPDRVKQFNDVIVPWMSHGGVPEEDDMQLSDDIWPGQKDKDQTVGDLFHRLDNFIDRQDARQKRTEAAVLELAKGMSPTVQAAVAKALEENTVSVDVNVHGKGAGQ